MPERSVRHLQQLGGADLDSAGLFQGRLDQRSFNTGNILLKIDSISGNVWSTGAIAVGCGGGAGARTVRLKIDLEFIAGFHGHSTLNGVFKLAHVAGPFKISERIERFLGDAQDALLSRARV